jgi:hypothetical protein
LPLIASSLAAVVVAARRDANLSIGDLVDEPVFVGDSSRPVACEIMLERFGLADPGLAVALTVLDEQVDALEYLAVLGLPPQVVLPCVGIPNQQPA